MTVAFQLAESIHVSALEVYMDQVYDLLSGRDQALHMRSRVVEKTLSELRKEVCYLHPRETYMPCSSTQQFEKLLEHVVSVRMCNATHVNDRSSRSHLILTLAVKRAVQVETPTARNANSSEIPAHALNLDPSYKTGREYMSKLILMDLAGNKRDFARNGLANEADLREEGKAVSASLFALSACLRKRANTSWSLRDKHQQRGSQTNADDGFLAKEPRSSCLDDEAKAQEKPGSEGENQGYDGTSCKDWSRLRGRFQPGAGIYRTSALTRLLKEPLSTAKIFFLACCSPAASSVATTCQTLEYACMVKKIKTSAEDSAVLLEKGLNQFPLAFIPHAAILKFKRIPRSDQAAGSGSTILLRELLRVSVIRVMVSHRWLNEKHPDNAHNVKHKLICGLFERLQTKGWIRSFDSMDVVDWIDYCEMTCSV